MGIESGDVAAGAAPSGGCGRGRMPADRAAIRVVVADDHAIFRRGLADLLREEPDIEVVAEASDGEMAVAAALDSIPHVVLMDVSMPRIDGIEATRRIAQAAPGVRVIGLSGYEDEQLAAAMRQAGAAMYLLKDSAPEALVAAVRAVGGPTVDGPETMI